MLSNILLSYIFSTDILQNSVFWSPIHLILLSRQALAQLR